MKLKNGRPPRMDLWGANPFDARFPQPGRRPVGRFRGFNDIDTLYAEIEKAYKKGNRKVPKLWLSEWTIVSDRPLPLFSSFFVSRKAQAVRLDAAYKIARRTPLCRRARLVHPARPGGNRRRRGLGFARRTG